MNCPKCKTEAELKTFDTFSYHYCGTCKSEVKEAQYTPIPIAAPYEIRLTSAIGGGTNRNTRNGCPPNSIITYAIRLNTIEECSSCGHRWAV